MKTKHTPGPWGISANNTSMSISSQSGAGAEICTIKLKGCKEEEWNSLLICAAPQLLAACEMALPEHHHEDDPSVHDGQIAGEITWGDVRRMKRAIAKATGEA
jgi:hypothetical protein